MRVLDLPWLFRQRERLGPMVAVEPRHPVFPIAFLRRREIVVRRILLGAQNRRADLRRYPHVRAGSENVRLGDAVTGEHRLERMRRVAPLSVLIATDLRMT